MSAIRNELHKRSSGKRNKKRPRKFLGTKASCLDSTTVPESASAKKIKYSNLTSASKEEPVFDGYRIMDMANLNQVLKSCLACKVCGGEIDIVETQVKGLGSNFSVECSMCEAVQKFSSCRLVGKNKNVMEINRRLVYAMRCLGLGLSGMKTFCCVMDLPPPVKQETYNLTVSNVLEATCAIADESMNKAAEEEMTISDSDTGKKEEISASFDGTWMKRGHTSLHGVVTCIGANTGKVIDIEVKSTHCKGCESWKGKRNGKEFEEWFASHKVKCTANHEGSSGKMEVAGVIDIFKRSQQKRGVKYVEYIGDGDTQSFQGVLKLQPYGPDKEVRKVECVGHVQKRMGTRLRKLKQSMTGKKLSDGKSIGGKGRLTDAAIQKLTTYYGNAIRKHRYSSQDMRKAIWATFFHTRSTDKEPVHNFCPKGEDSWCGYNKQQALGSEAPYHHKNTIPSAVMDSIQPVFKDLSSPQLLDRCLGGRTQNNNESINNLIWKYCPKTSFSGRRIVEIASNEAVIGFNDGLKGRLKVMKQLQCTPGRFCIAAMAEEDQRRIKNADSRAMSATLEVRRSLKLKKTIIAEKALAEEGVVYGAGQF